MDWSPEIWFFSNFCCFVFAGEKLLDISNFDRQNIGKFTVTAATQSKLEKVSYTEVS